MKDPEHAADEGEAEGDQQIDGPHDETVDKGKEDRVPHYEARPLSGRRFAVQVVGQSGRDFLFVKALVSYPVNI